MLYFSVHRHDGGHFCAPGDASTTSRSSGFTINVPWEGPGAGDREYLAVLGTILPGRPHRSYRWQCGPTVWPTLWEGTRYEGFCYHSPLISCLGPQSILFGVKTCCLWSKIVRGTIF